MSRPFEIDETFATHGGPDPEESFGEFTRWLIGKSPRECGESGGAMGFALAVMFVACYPRPQKRSAWMRRLVLTLAGGAD